jgi:hypothetical protein
MAAAAAKGVAIAFGGGGVDVPYALWVTLLLPGAWASMLVGALYGTVLGSGLIFVGPASGRWRPCCSGGPGWGIGSGDA